MEDRILSLKEMKQALADGALGVEGMQTVGRKRIGLSELMSLFRDVGARVDGEESGGGSGSNAALLNRVVRRAGQS